jgi:hypothetical protein
MLLCSSMRRALCLILYSVMTGSGGTGLVTVFLNYNGMVSLRFIGACAFLLLFGGYLLWIDFLKPVVTVMPLGGVSTTMKGHRRTQVSALGRERNPQDPTTWRDVRRNESCPCGSGKRYKHCHGSLVWTPPGPLWKPRRASLLTSRPPDSSRRNLHS